MRNWYRRCALCCSVSGGKCSDGGVERGQRQQGRRRLPEGVSSGGVEGADYNPEKFPFCCSAFVNGLSGKEYWEAAQVNAQRDVYFIIRYCSEVAGMDTEHYRILFRGQVYDLVFIDNVRYQNRMLKLRASLVKR